MSKKPKSKSGKRKKRIRPLALCVFRRGDKIFVSRGYDKRKDETFYRPIGGRIEFGERSRATIIREVREEIGAEVTDLNYLGALENIFTYEGRPMHEIVLIFDGTFTDRALNQDDISVSGTDAGEILYDAGWQPIAFFKAKDAPPLYPTGLLALLTEPDST